MANAFMPSALSSLNAAGQDSLEQIMKQRLFEQQMQQAQLQGQGQLNNFRLDLRQQDAQERYRQDVIAQNELETQARLRIAQDKLGADAASAGAETQARTAIAEAMAAGNWELAQQLAVRAGVSLPARPSKVKTADDLRAEAKARAEGAAEGKAAGLDRFPQLRPTRAAKGAKPAKDNPKVPSGFLAAIEGRKGTAGFDSADNALKSIEGRWGDWRKNYPSLDLNAVRAAVQNVYGQRVSGGNSGLDAIVGAAIEAAMKVQNDD